MLQFSFFLCSFSFSSAASSDQDLKGRVKGLGFGFMVLRVLVGIDWGYFAVGLGWPQFFYFGVLSQEGQFFIGILNIGMSFENEFWSRQTAASLCRSNSGI